MIGHPLLSTATKGKARRIFVAVAVTVGVSACALGSKSAEANVTTPGTPEHACAVGMGLTQSTQRYSDCVASLQRTQTAMGRAEAVSAARDRCAQRGLQDGTPAFALCVVDGNQMAATVSNASEGK